MLCVIPDCRCPIRDGGPHYRVNPYGPVCQVCWDMFMAVYGNDWFTSAQHEFYRQRVKVDRLRPGREES